MQKQITIEELRAQTLKALLDTIREVEKAHADVLAKTYAAFMQAVVQSPIMQRTWATVVLVELAVLAWAQVGVPAIVAVGWVDRWPSAGATIDWAYALLAFCVGAGPLVLRTGPGKRDPKKLKQVTAK